MPANPEPSASLSVDQFAERHRREMIPVGKNISYLSTDGPLSAEDLREYLEEPIAAMPPTIAAILPKISIVLAPYLEKADKAARERVASVRPTGNQQSTRSCVLTKGEAVVLGFAVKDQEVADYHYHFFNSLAGLVADKWDDRARAEYQSLLRQELTAEVHGEVDEKSWHLKQQVTRRDSTWKTDTKVFKDYAKQSFIDTLTLYLHGICCDIDVEPGPRQLPSRYMRKRLLLIESLFPPPEGYAVFPEQLNRESARRS